MMLSATSKSRAALQRIMCQGRSSSLVRLLSYSVPQPTDEDEEEVFDSFRILGLPRTFQLSEEDLKQSYRQLMKSYHPDLHTSKPLPERERIEEMASQVTSAFQILKQPHTRATHLLDLVGTPMEETSSSDLVGMEFLMRESVEKLSPSSSVCLLFLTAVSCT